MKIKHLKCKIIRNGKIADRFYKIAIRSNYLARQSKPGQFMEVKCSDSFETLLRRPLGVHRISKNGIEILYEVVGKGTEILSGRKPGEYLDIIGPLGNGFNLKLSTIHYPLSTILVAGGIGVAPLLALADSLVNSAECIVDRKKIKIYVFIGAKTASHILCAKDFKKIGCDTHIATEDDSIGSKGLITDTLKSFLSTIHYPPSTAIYACGPVAMLKAVAKIAADRKIKCQVSLEERMACGVGVCLGCPVKVNRLTGLPVSRFKPAHRHTGNYTYKMVCKDGPVFNAEEIAW